MAGSEVYGHRLFSRAAYTKALEDCGFKIEYVQGVLGNRGLFLGIRQN